jgi:anti-sigma factor RsiW
MSDHVADDLPRLLRGDASRDVTAAAADHLRDCADCQQELADLVAAHAALVSMQRLGLEPVRTRLPMPDARPVVPPESAIASIPRVRRPAGISRVAVIAGIVAAGITIGGVAVAQHRNSVPAIQFVRLAADGQGTVSGSAQVFDGDQVRLDARDLPQPVAGHYQVWLTDSACTVMYAIGVLGPDRTGDFTVAPMVLDRYSDIEVSVQPANDGGFSGVNVLRGRYS